MSYRFRRAERLKSRKQITALFTSGSSFHCFPIRVKYRLLNDAQNQSIRIAFSVPKRQVKRAVDRNRIKRRMREAYRLNRDALVPPPAKRGVEVMFIYSSSKLESYHRVNNATIEVLKRLANLISS